MKQFYDGEASESGKVIRLQESLGDLQELAAKIAAGEVQREDVLWRLRSYFYVVGVVIEEAKRGLSLGSDTRLAVSLLSEIQRLVNDLIIELADGELSEELDEMPIDPRPAPCRASTDGSIIPFPGRPIVDSDDRW